MHEIPRFRNHLQDPWNWQPSYLVQKTREKSY